MKKSGFTLVELLGVIVLLGALLLIVLPKIVNSVKLSGKDADDLTMKLIYEASNLYLSDNIGNYPQRNGNTYCVTIKDLVSEGYLKSPVKLTSDDKDITNSKTIEASYQNGYEFELKENGTCVSVLQYADSILNGADPELSGMTAVVYDGDNWKVANTNSEWYDYTNQEWANAVILKSGVTKNVGDTIDVSSEVKAMFVWIPRYEYKIEGTYGKGGTSATSPGEIEVNFISKDVTTASSGYIVHPAFTFGTDELSGIWVGKFETSTDTSSTCYTSESEDNCNNTNQDPYIIPNVSSLRYQQPSNQFQTAQKFNTYITNADSHMMKNSEWGAVAYLSQSKYGKYGNSNYTGANKEIYQNKSSSFITGSSNGTPSTSTTNTQCTYDNTTNNCGIGASTTGNITGIYDMSGGAWEYVMGVFANSSGQLWSGYSASYNSGYTGLVGTSGTLYTGTAFPDLKYYDVYKATTGTTISSTTACNAGICYGHALSETTGWYGDRAAFVYANGPWFLRGGSCSNDASAGVFYFVGDNGDSSNGYSFRVVVSQATN